MTHRLKAVIGLTYPEPKSLELVLEAGGLSKLTAKQRAKVKLRYVKPGEWCDDLPECSRDHLITKGSVIKVAIEEKSSITPITPRRRK